MAYLVKPDLEELSFRQKLHQSAATMGGKEHTDSFPEEKWSSFYNDVVEADPKKVFYRYLYCPVCADFTGEMGWIHNEKHRRYELFILIRKEHRGEGYGREGIENLMNAARKNGISKLYAVVDEENPAVGFFSHMEMKKESEGEGKVIFSKDTCREKKKIK